jgi:hypothetical protein
MMDMEAAHRKVDGPLHAIYLALQERLGDDKVAFFLPGQYPGFSGNPEEPAGVAVEAPSRPDTNKSTRGMIYTVPVEPDPWPYVKIMSPLVIGLDNSHAEMAMAHVNNLNKNLLRAHLVFKNYEIGSAIEAQSGLPIVDGKLDLELLITLLGETVGMADLLDDQLVEELGVGRTILP